MAAGDIEVRINSETKAFKIGVERGIIDPLEDAEKALEELGRTRGPEELERELRQAQKSTEKLADETKDTARQIERSYKDASRDIGDSGRQGFRKLGDAGKEVSGELRQNLGETFASFRGDLEDLPQIAQDTLAGLAGSGAIGGIAGLAATAAGAAGLGLIVASLETQNEEAEKLKQRLSDAYTQAIEAGRDYIDEAQVIAELQDLMFNRDRAGEYNRLLEDQKQLGVDIETLAGANIGRQEDLRAIQERINTLKQQGNKSDRESDSILGGIDTGLAGIANRWTDVQEETEAQKQKVAELEAAEKRLNETAREQINRTADAAQKRYEALAREPVKLKLEVDDSNVRNYRAPTIRIPGQLVVGPAGTGVRTWQ